MNARFAPLPRITPAVALAAALVHVGHAAPLLQLDRAHLWPNLWQLATCQLAHWSDDHLLWDAIVFLALGSICEWSSRKQFALTLVAANLLVPLAVLVFCPHITHFRGLSGIDSALFGLLITRLFVSSRRDDDRLCLALVTSGGALFLGKCLYESLTGDALFVSRADTFAVVPIAHLAGFIVGIACGFLRTNASRSAYDEVRTWPVMSGIGR